MLRPGDLLVLNDTRVLPARLLGRQERTGGQWEGLFLRQHADGAWELLCQTRGRPAVGEIIRVRRRPAPGLAAAPAARGRTAEGHWLARPDRPGCHADLLGRVRPGAAAAVHPQGPGRPADRDRYQTVYARQPGSVAAPTAGLHFTPELFDALRQRGIDWTFVTLHVGIGTFQPIQVEDVDASTASTREWCELPAATAEAIADVQGARRPGRRGRHHLHADPGNGRPASGPLRPWSGEPT